MKNLLLYCVTLAQRPGMQLLKKATTDDGKGDLEWQNYRGE
jgi:hypothetical protein